MPRLGRFLFREQRAMIVLASARDIYMTPESRYMELRVCAPAISSHPPEWNLVCAGGAALHSNKKVRHWRTFYLLNL